MTRDTLAEPHQEQLKDPSVLHLHDQLLYNGLAALTTTIAKQKAAVHLQLLSKARSHTKTEAHRA